MGRFYELYKDNEKVSPLVTQLSWTNQRGIEKIDKQCNEQD